jgi:hypothetical protein
MTDGLKKKKSLLVIRNLVVAEVLAYGVFLAVALSAYWGQIYRMHFPTLSRYLSFTVIEFLLLGVVQLFIIVFVVSKSVHEEQDVRDIIRSAEHEHLEFKTSLRWDVKRGQVNKDLEKGVMKTITAFLNSSGGTLVVGVDDHRQIYGLEADLASLTKQNHDGFENHFNNVFVSMIGPEFRKYVKLSFHYINNKSVSLVEVERGHRPAYLKTDKGEDFFIRTGNATTPLRVSQVASYISSQWRE